MPDDQITKIAEYMAIRGQITGITLSRWTTSARSFAGARSLMLHAPWLA